MGTPLYLKNTFGDGYRITLTTDQPNVTRVLQLISDIVPSAKLLDEAGGSLVFGVPIANISDLSPILKLMQDENTNRKSFDIWPEGLKELQSFILDCGVSMTTLEEVFMKVTGKKVSRNMIRNEEIKESKIE